jgi:hypothetical protein
VFGRVLRYVREQFAFLLVLALLVASLLYLTVDSGRWGRASGGVAVAVLLAGVFRLVLPGDRAGLLAIRGRVVDSVTFLVLGAVILGIDVRLHG